MERMNSFETDHTNSSSDEDIFMKHTQFKEKRENFERNPSIVDNLLIDIYERYLEYYIS